MQDKTGYYFQKKQSINIRGALFCFDQPRVMGIINITPDSFYSGSRYNSEKQIVRKIENFISNGADIIDLGAYSSRPGADDIPIEEERQRLNPVLKAIRQSVPQAIISLDTFRSEIAREMVLEHGVDMINDISAGGLDPMMHDTIAELDIPYIMMHMKGTPQNMKEKAQYTNLIQEMMFYFSEKARALKLLGVKDIIIDPGIGFAKNSVHNYKVLRNLDVFQYFELPLLVGLSRKSMIWQTLDIDPSRALNGTTALNMLALQNGADILRVHDVKEAKEAIDLYLAYKNG
jgi:dihydropteroate synthase